MSIDERLRTALRDAAGGGPLDEERALRTVRARVQMPATGAAVEPVEVEEHRRPPARAPRVIAVLAVCALLAGAVALPFALRSTREHTPGVAAATGRCGQTVANGYRSAAVVRLVPVPPGRAIGPRIEFPDPVPAALALCDTVLSHNRPRTDEISFAAKTNARGDELSLTVVTPNSADTAGLARSWATRFARVRRADAARQIREQRQRLTDRVHTLRDELVRVDRKLANLAPRIYGNVLNVDTPVSRLPSGKPPDTVPPVPEQGPVKVLNLAYERLSLLHAIEKSAQVYAAYRIAAQVRPDAYATAVSVSSPVRFPASGGDSSSSAVLVAVGLLAGGALLAAGSFLLGRRSRRAQAP